MKHLIPVILAGAGAILSLITLCVAPHWTGWLAGALFVLAFVLAVFEGAAEWQRQGPQLVLDCDTRDGGALTARVLAGGPARDLEIEEVRKNDAIARFEPVNLVEGPIPVNLAVSVEISEGGTSVNTVDLRSFFRSDLATPVFSAGSGISRTLVVARYKDFHGARFKSVHEIEYDLVQGTYGISLKKRRRLPPWDRGQHG